jgi:hypothetical protein
MPETDRPPQKISPLFVSRFQVDETAPFERHLNRLEVEIGCEDYSGLKQVELLPHVPPETFFSNLTELTERLLHTTQNNYNRQLIKRLGIRIYLDVNRYHVYYRLPQRCIRFRPSWREQVLESFFDSLPESSTPWQDCQFLPDFRCRYIADEAGGTLLLTKENADPGLPVLTVSHGPYDPHTLEVALYFLHYGKGRAALINLGFSGREPLADSNLQKLKEWGVPLNPSNIDVIYPYVDDRGHPYCYKHEEGLCLYVNDLPGPAPRLIVDVHGYVGMTAEDQRILVGLGGLPPYPQLSELGEQKVSRDLIYLQPAAWLKSGLRMIRELSEEIYVQFCTGPHQGYHLGMLGGLQLIGRQFDPRQEVASLLPGEERSYLPNDNVRWLPSAGANAKQRIEACKLGCHAQCLHVEIPTLIRRQIAWKMRQVFGEKALAIFSCRLAGPVD